MKAVLIKVATTSSPSKVAGAIAGILRTGVAVSVQAVGFASLARASAAIALATKFMSAEKIQLVCSIQALQVAVETKKHLQGYRFDLDKSGIFPFDSGREFEEVSNER